MKRKCGVLSASVAALACCSIFLTGCGFVPHDQAESQESVDFGYVITSENEALRETIANRDELHLVESGFTVDEDGYVRCFGIVENPNDKLVARGVRFEVIGYGSNDLILLSDTVYLNSPLLPHQKMAFIDTAFLSQGGLERVEFVPPTDGDRYSGTQWLDQSAADDALTAESFKVEVTGEERGEYGSWKITGTLTSSSDTAADSATVYIALRNADGALVGVYSDYLSNIPARGSISFEMNDYDIPDYSSYEFYVDPASWS